MLRLRGSKTTLVDLGHHVNYFVRGLLQYLTKDTSYRFLFVRVNSDRYEAAISLASCEQRGNQRTIPEYRLKGALCGSYMWSYCPLLKTQAVGLTVPGGNKTWNDIVLTVSGGYKPWNEFTWYQQSLWLVDEVDARWSQLLEEYPRMETVDVVWGKRWPGSIEEAAERIGTLLRVENMEVNAAAHLKVHGGTSTEGSQLQQEVALQDAQYQHIMKGRAPGLLQAVNRVGDDIEPVGVNRCNYWEDVGLRLVRTGGTNRTKAGKAANSSLPRPPHPP
jgi:hypothetical protein